MKLYYLGLKDDSTVKGNLFITSYMVLNSRGNYIIDFDDCKCNWWLFCPTDIELNRLKEEGKTDSDKLAAYNEGKKWQKRKEVSPEDFDKTFEILGGPDSCYKL